MHVISRRAIYERISNLFHSDLWEVLVTKSIHCDAYVIQALPPDRINFNIRSSNLQLPKALDIGPAHSEVIFENINSHKL